MNKYNNPIETNILYLSSNDNFELQECSICLNNIDYNISFLPCNHYYHIKCILKWSKFQKKYKKKLLCPLCKQEYSYIQLANNILNYNYKIIYTMIVKLKYIIYNNKLSIFNFIKIKLLIYKYNCVLDQIKYDIKYLPKLYNSPYCTYIVLNLHPSIEKIISTTNFTIESCNKKNHFLSKKYRNCLSFFLCFNI